MKYFFPLLALLFLVGCGGDPAPTQETATVQEDVPATNPKAEMPTFEDVAFAEAEPEVTGEEISYSTATTKMNGYIAYDEKKTGKRPGILVVHEWWGHNDYARQRANMLADLGYVALAVDMYGDGKQAAHPDDAGKFSGAVFANIDEAKARFEAALETLKANELVDGDQIAAIGYCFGGSVVLSMANAGFDLDAVAAFHSGVELPIMPKEGEELKTKILVANGSADPFIPLESVVEWTKKMEEIGADYEYLSIQDAKHGFTDPGADANGKKFGLPLEYNEAGDRKTWLSLQKMLYAAFND
jgi:dienelactone hydrolase